MVTEAEAKRRVAECRFHLSNAAEELVDEWHRDRRIPDRNGEVHVDADMMKGLSDLVGALRRAEEEHGAAILREQADTAARLGQGPL